VGRNEPGRWTIVLADEEALTASAVPLAPVCHAIRQVEPQDAGAVVHGAAERVESLGAFLTDQEAGLVCQGAVGQPQGAPEQQHQQRQQREQTAVLPVTCTSDGLDGADSVRAPLRDEVESDAVACATTAPPAAPCGATAAGPDTRPAVAGPVTAARSASQTMASVFASSAGTVAAAAAASGAAAAQPESQLRARLEELLRCADSVAAQLAQRDPQSAASQVLQAVRDTDFLFKCILSGTTGK
jgi:hypothetical protein